MTTVNNEQPNTPPRPRWFQFSLRTALLAMFGVALFLAGRASVEHRDLLAPPLEGTWQATLPRGHQKPVTITKLEDGQYSLGTGGVLSGTYQWRDGRLTVVDPADDRMKGLVWSWDGQRLTLVGEPGDTPTGSSYTGTMLTRPVDQAPSANNQ